MKHTGKSIICNKEMICLSFIAGIGIASSESVMANEVFDTRFLEKVPGSNSVADLSMFSQESDVQPQGDYRVDIYINDTFFDTQSIQFKQTEYKESKGQPTKGLLPCLDYEKLKSFGIRMNAFPRLAAYAVTENTKEDEAEADKTAETEETGLDSTSEALPDDIDKESVAVDKTCIPVMDIIPNTSIDFDFYQQRLNLSFPQASIENQARGYIDPKYWDNGITALLVDYNFSGSNSRIKTSNTVYEEDGTGSTPSDGEEGIATPEPGENKRAHRYYTKGNYSSYYLSLRNGLNIGPWRLRNYSTWTGGDGNSRWRSINTYAQRNLVGIRSQLVVGDTSTSGEIFDSIQFRGIQLGSDDEMMPDSLKGFAPVIRGIARSNAQVTIKQNGYIIYQSYVTPGAFEITDLYPTASSGDLDVTVKEEDGSEQNFVQSFSAVPLLQREGRVKYSVSVGQYRNGYGGGKPNFGSASAMWGLPRGYTLYGGAIGSTDYKSLALGLGKNLGIIGAVSLDVTHAVSDLDDDKRKSGQSIRFLYAKSFANSGTDVRLLGYRYSTKGFYTFQEATDFSHEGSTVYDRVYNKRSRIEGTLTQSLGGWGSVYGNLSSQNYWGDKGKEERLQVGYNGNVKSVSYSLSYSYARSPDYENTDQIFSFNMSIPLDTLLGNSWSSYQMTTQKNGPTTQQVGLFGTLLKGQNLNYSVQQSYGSQGTGYSGGATMDYRGRFGNSNVGYSYGKNSRQVNYGLSGGAIVHADGITLSQPLGDTVALVKAKGASQTNVLNNIGVKTDPWGYAVVPYISPYRSTRISLDSESLGDNVDLVESTTTVIPTRGAVVRATFDTRVGYRVLMNLTRRNGEPVPFGAVASIKAVEDEKQVERRADPNNGFIVGDAGQLYISGLEENGQLWVQWGKSPDQQCAVNYQLPTEQLNASAEKKTPQASQVITVAAKCQ